MNAGVEPFITALFVTDGKNKEKKIALFGSSPMNILLVSLLLSLKCTVTMLSNGECGLDADSRTRLQPSGVKFVDGEVALVKHDRCVISSVVMKDGSKHAFDAIFAHLPDEQACAIPEKLGCELGDSNCLKIDNTHQTTVKGVYACGDASHMVRQIGSAASDGSVTAAFIAIELSMSEMMSL